MDNLAKKTVTCTYEYLYDILDPHDYITIAETDKDYRMLAYLFIKSNDERNGYYSVEDIFYSSFTENTELIDNYFKLLIDLDYDINKLYIGDLAEPDIYYFNSRLLAIEYGLNKNHVFLPQEKMNISFFFDALNKKFVDLVGSANRELLDLKRLAKIYNTDCILLYKDKEIPMMKLYLEGIPYFDSLLHFSKSSKSIYTLPDEYILENIINVMYENILPDTIEYAYHDFEFNEVDIYGIVDLYKLYDYFAMSKHKEDLGTQIRDDYQHADIAENKDKILGLLVANNVKEIIDHARSSFDVMTSLLEFEYHTDSTIYCADGDFSIHSTMISDVSTSDAFDAINDNLAAEEAKFIILLSYYEDKCINYRSLLDIYVSPSEETFTFIVKCYNIYKCQYVEGIILNRWFSQKDNSDSDAYDDECYNDSEKISNLLKLLHDNTLKIQDEDEICECGYNSKVCFRQVFFENDYKNATCVGELCLK